MKTAGLLLKATLPKMKRGGPAQICFKSKEVEIKQTELIIKPLRL